jgi:hypothetical protein
LLRAAKNPEKDMTTLTHTRGPFERISNSPGRRDTVDAGRAEAHLATFKRFCRCALTVLLVGGAVAGIIALKAAIYLSRLNY